MDFSLYLLSDIIEIVAFTIGYYFLTSWLSCQENKKLLFYWYGYHALIMLAYVSNLSNLFFILACCFPLVCMLCIVFHEQRLQKMFVVAQRLDPLTTTSSKSSWHDELMKFALARLNEQKDLYVIIENNDTLSSLVKASELINADLKKNTLELLYDSFTPPKESFLWITGAGKIVALHGQWKNFSLSDTHQVTTAVDCLAFYACAATRRFSVICDSKLLENLSAHHALALLKELPTTPYKKQESSHDIKTDFSSYNDTPFS